MPDVLVRNVDDATLAYWKERARSNGRSLQAELAALLQLESEQTLSREESKRRAAAWRKVNANLGVSLIDLIREDRDSDHGRDPV